MYKIIPGSIDSDNVVYDFKTISDLESVIEYRSVNGRLTVKQDFLLATSDSIGEPLSYIPESIWKSYSNEDIWKFCLPVYKELIGKKIIKI